MQVMEWRLEKSHGFLPALTLSTHLNVRRVLGNTSPGCYFLRASNSMFHNLTNNHSLPPTAASLLGLGLKFIPTPSHSPAAEEIAPWLDRIKRDIGLKTYFAGRDEGENLKLRAKSIWRPPLPPRDIDLWVNSFIKQLSGEFFWRREKKNLTPRQRQLLITVRKNTSTLIDSTDKNLGPVGIEADLYIKLGLEHLLDLLTYKLLSEQQAHQDAINLESQIYNWTVHNRQALSDDEANFIQKHLEANKDPHGYFYLLIKLHKEKILGRPVCFDCGSLPHALGRWVDAQLQPIIKDQALYFKNSFTLKADLDGLDIPPNASLYTYDAVAMYPSINTVQCLEQLLGYLSSPDIASYYGINPTALLKAIAIVMYNNCMRFGNVLVKQISGIAMGMSPAPTLANLFMAIYERDHVLQYIPAMVKYLRRFINDGFRIWL
jgi:hypothetical protein